MRSSAFNDQSASQCHVSGFFHCISFCFLNSHYPIFMSHLAPPSSEPSRRPRSSVDVDRPQVDASILGIPQGWDDDPQVDVIHDRTESMDDRTPARQTPLRHRIHLTSRANRSRTVVQTQIPVGRRDIAHAPVLTKAIGHETHISRSAQVASSPRRTSSAFKDDRQAGMFESNKKRHCGEGIYRVGYEREVLDMWV